ncbi:MAG TPA: mercury methylation corrinoid protein HgcA [Acidobacteriota bacterium]|nr:mercury methylation corrinoid protein HgcA [Acidobacteriota bacterium]
MTTDRSHTDAESDAQDCCSAGVRVPEHTDAPTTAVLGERPSWITGAVDTTVGSVPVVDTSLRWSDRLGSWKVRWGIGRSRYRIAPGLYAVGQPTPESHVFVTANFKMSFDRLRSQLGGIDAWILVLDTKGINVWCAAGKGTFGTDEIVARIAATRLNEIVSHRRLILPQLGAPGVSAHEVKARSSFHVVYGPVRAADIPAFLAARMTATAEMRQVRFAFRDRAVLIPVELVGTARYALLIAVALFLLSGFGPGVYAWERAVAWGIPSAALWLIACAAGAILPPALLPWLPGRAFSLKGGLLGIVVGLGALWLIFPSLVTSRGYLAALPWLFWFPAVISFIAMNFTGSSTYTSLSGVRKEMRVAVPVQIALTALGLILWLVKPFVS